jgi:hypothetical protein
VSCARAENGVFAFATSCGLRRAVQSSSVIVKCDGDVSTRKITPIGGSSPFSAETQCLHVLHSMMGTERPVTRFTEYVPKHKVTTSTYVIDDGEDDW